MTRQSKIIEASSWKEYMLKVDPSIKDDTTTISVRWLVGSACGLSEDGNKLYDHIATALRNDKKVVLSFDGVEVLTSCFLNNAIGRLYGVFDWGKIRSSIDVIDITREDKKLIKDVTDFAKIYFGGNHDPASKFMA